MGAVENRLTEDMQLMLAQLFTESEVTKAFFLMFPTKAPGPDEALSALIRRKVEEGVLHGVQIYRRAPVISQLFFCR